MPRPRLTGLVWILSCEARASCVIVALGQRAIEQLIENDRLAHHLFGRGGVAVVQKIPAPQFDRIHADGRGDLVHVALDGKDGLRRAKSAKRAIGHGVRGPRRASERARWGTHTGPASAAWRAKARSTRACE